MNIEYAIYKTIAHNIPTTRHYWNKVVNVFDQTLRFGTNKIYLQKLLDGTGSCIKKHSTYTTYLLLHFPSFFDT